MNQVLIKIEGIACYVAGACVVVMMVLVTVDALGRYFFASPLRFQFELTTHYLMVAASLLGFAWGKRQGAFIKLTGAGRLLGTTGRNWLAAFNNIIAAVLFALATWYSAERAWSAFQAGDTYFGVIDWPVWLAEILVPIGCGLLTLRLLCDAGMLLLPGAELPESEADSRQAEMTEAEQVADEGANP